MDDSRLPGHYPMTPHPTSKYIPATSQTTTPQSPAAGGPIRWAGRGTSRGSVRRNGGPSTPYSRPLEEAGLGESVGRRSLRTEEDEEELLAKSISQKTSSFVRSLVHTVGGWFGNSPTPANVQNLVPRTSVPKRSRTSVMEEGGVDSDYDHNGEHLLEFGGTSENNMEDVRKVQDMNSPSLAPHYAGHTPWVVKTRSQPQSKFASLPSRRLQGPTRQDLNTSRWAERDRQTIEWARQYNIDLRALAHGEIVRRPPLPTFADIEKFEALKKDVAFFKRQGINFTGPLPDSERNRVLRQARSQFELRRAVGDESLRRLGAEPLWSLENTTDRLRAFRALTHSRTRDRSLKMEESSFRRLKSESGYPAPRSHSPNLDIRRHDSRSSLRSALSREGSALPVEGKVVDGVWVIPSSSQTMLLDPPTGSRPSTRGSVGADVRGRSPLSLYDDGKSFEKWKRDKTVRERGSLVDLAPMKKNIIEEDVENGGIEIGVQTTDSTLLSPPPPPSPLAHLPHSRSRLKPSRQPNDLMERLRNAPLQPEIKEGRKRFAGYFSAKDEDLPEEIDEEAWAYDEAPRRKRFRTSRHRGALVNDDDQIEYVSRGNELMEHDEQMEGERRRRWNDIFNERGLRKSDFIETGEIIPDGPFAGEKVIKEMDHSAIDRQKREEEEERKKQLFGGGVPEQPEFVIGQNTRTKFVNGEADNENKMNSNELHKEGMNELVQNGERSKLDQMSASRLNGETASKPTPIFGGDAAVSIDTVKTPAINLTSAEDDSSKPSFSFTIKPSSTFYPGFGEQNLDKSAFGKIEHDGPEKPTFSFTVPEKKNGKQAVAMEFPDSGTSSDSTTFKRKSIEENRSRENTTSLFRGLDNVASGSIPMFNFGKSEEKKDDESSVQTKPSPFGGEGFKGLPTLAAGSEIRRPLSNSFNPPTSGVPKFEAPSIPRPIMQSDTKPAVRAEEETGALERMNSISEGTTESRPTSFFGNVIGTGIANGSKDNMGEDMVVESIPGSSKSGGDSAVNAILPSTTNTPFFGVGEKVKGDIFGKTDIGKDSSVLSPWTTAIKGDSTAPKVTVEGQNAGDGSKSTGFQWTRPTDSSTLDQDKEAPKAGFSGFGATGKPSGFGQVRSSENKDDSKPIASLFGKPGPVAESNRISKPAFGFPPGGNALGSTSNEFNKVNASTEKKEISKPSFFGQTVTPATENQNVAKPPSAFGGFGQQSVAEKPAAVNSMFPGFGQASSQTGIQDSSKSTFGGFGSGTGGFVQASENKDPPKPFSFGVSNAPAFGQSAKAETSSSIAPSAPSFGKFGEAPTSTIFGAVSQKPSFGNPNSTNEMNGIGSAAPSFNFNANAVQSTNFKPFEQQQGKGDIFNSAPASPAGGNQQIQNPFSGMQQAQGQQQSVFGAPSTSFAFNQASTTSPFAYGNGGNLPASPSFATGMDSATPLFTLGTPMQKSASEQGPGTTTPSGRKIAPMRRRGAGSRR